MKHPLIVRLFIVSIMLMLSIKSDAICILDSVFPEIPTMPKCFRTYSTICKKNESGILSEEDINKYVLQQQNPSSIQFYSHSWFPIGKFKFEENDFYILEKVYFPECTEIYLAYFGAAEAFPALLLLYSGNYDGSRGLINFFYDNGRITLFYYEHLGEFPILKRKLYYLAPNFPEIKLQK